MSGRRRRMRGMAAMAAAWAMALPAACAEQDRGPERGSTVFSTLGRPISPGKPMPQASEAIAGRIFDMPVPVANYYFAKRVLYTFPRPWEENLDPAARERAVWEALILHYESFRRDITVSEDELEKRINSVLKSQNQAFTRAGDPAAYAAWVKDALGEDVDLFENQMRYLYQVDKLRDEVRRSLPVSVTDEELQQEFLNEQHHVGGEMVTFESQEEAQAFYETVKTPTAWDAMKKQGKRTVRPVSLMTLEAYMDLWSIPKDQMYAFHALPLGAVGEPMPFGRQWCVYRLLEKRTGDLAEFPAQRDAYVQQVTAKKQYDALKVWIEDLKRSATLEVYPLPAPSAQ